MMSATSETLHPRSESARINLRTSPEAKALIERAAALMGTTVSSFMLQNAYEAAQRLVAGHDTLTLADRDRDAFLAAMDNPGEPNQALRDLLRRG
jgi:uncharacterized protein (DUF1778 family)